MPVCDIGGGLLFPQNAGCTVRRIVTTRISADGYLWSPDAACPGRIEESCGDVATCDTGYNTSGMIVPDPVDDPPELEFCEQDSFRLNFTCVQSPPELSLERLT